MSRKVSALCEQAKEQAMGQSKAAKLAMPLREVKSRVEMQMPILRTGLFECNTAPLPQNGYDPLSVT